ncbi:hypothetical protein [Sporomusa sphaeroides]|uniref:HTH cro/C1-type domain-containing protein n=1 Tax=Sporomusa sphaeroides DSM 2875 TaxID=1337886 RepID=A0A1U7M9S6_9FIRM|nr:hypothetical protein [Sporomusa sphaeroides]OLS54310.1 hypothetical protein SPSPH_45560 [Sporomusa sphaeroides DSM 2875]CVK21540.1 hypothetical protein SSPH_04232 [Sporomusa sphaeroides DSM 2875]
MLGVFDKALFATLLKKSMDIRTINEYGRQTMVSPSYISRLLRQLLPDPPSPEIIRKISNHARNDITYEQFMMAAGHIPCSAMERSSLKTDDEAVTTIKAIWEFMSQHNITLEELEQLLTILRIIRAK